jgi:hypothetical protein
LLPASSGLLLNGNALVWFDRARRLAIQALQETIQHHPHFFQWRKDLNEGGGRNDPEVAGDYQVMLELGCRAQGIAKKAAELRFALLFSPFNDVSLNRHRRANDLTSQGGVLRPSNRERYLVGAQRERMRLLPNAKFLEIGDWGQLRPSLGVSRTR